MVMPIIPLPEGVEPSPKQELGLESTEGAMADATVRPGMLHKLRGALGGIRLGRKKPQAEVLGATMPKGVDVNSVEGMALLFGGAGATAPVAAGRQETAEPSSTEPARASMAAGTPLHQVDEGVRGGLAAEETSSRARLARLFKTRSTGDGRHPERPVVPIAILFGYLPDVRERDAQEYAIGYAAEFLQTQASVFYEVFPYRQGYAFEVQQGGNGKAFLPGILKHFDSLGEFVAGENSRLVISTATRQAEVYRTREGLDFVLLPEGSNKEASDWLTPSTSMTPVINRKTGFFVASAALFATGFIAMMVTGMLTRYQEWEPAPPPHVAFVKLQDTPAGQWSRLQNVPSTSYVKALRFRNGTWEQPEVVVDQEMVKRQREAEMAAQAPIVPVSTNSDAEGTAQ